MKKYLGRFNFIGIDSNVFIYYFNEHSQFGKPAKQIIDSLSIGKTKAVTNQITLIELLSHPILSEKDAKDMARQFSEIPNLSMVGIDHNLALEAARIRRKYTFKLPDSIQLATAVSAKAKAFISNDEGLKKFTELKVILLNEL